MNVAVDHLEVRPQMLARHFDHGGGDAVALFLARLQTQLPQFGHGRMVRSGTQPGPPVASCISLFRAVEKAPDATDVALGCAVLPVGLQAGVR